MSWSVASVLSRKPAAPVQGHERRSADARRRHLSHPRCGHSGEFHGFNPRIISGSAWFALVYLIVFGSLIGFTAYVWLLHHESPTKVGTYAYVNPVVAVLLGYFLGGEGLGMRTILGTLFVLVSVLVITTTPARKILPKLAVEDA